MCYDIYCITNKLNGMSYVGQSVDALERWKDHLYDAYREVGKTVNKKTYIHNAIKLYGDDNFIWQVIDHCETLNESNELEEFYIAYLDTFSPRGYNLTRGGNNHEISEETKEKIRAKLKIVGSFVGKKGKDHPNFGTHLSKERKLAQSKALSGDNGPGKKITSQIARQIYLDCLNYETPTKILIQKYGLKQGAILNIINKKCWKDATKDLPKIDLAERTRGEKWIKSKLTEWQVMEIIEKYKTGNYTMQQLADQYHIKTTGGISSIINGRRWKHIKR